MLINVTGSHPNCVLSLVAEQQAEYYHLLAILEAAKKAGVDVMTRGERCEAPNYEAFSLMFRLEEENAHRLQRLDGVTLEQALGGFPIDGVARQQLRNLQETALKWATRERTFVRSTHTFAKLEISRAAFDEIAGKLKEAGYDHAFVEPELIDMHGIAVHPPGA